jgi:hypothetical protein
MRISDVITESIQELDETSEDDHALAQIAQGVVDNLRSGKISKFQKYLDRLRTNTPTKADNTTGVKLGLLGKVIKTKPTSTAIQEILDTVTLITVMDLPKAEGTYNKDSKELKLVIIPYKLAGGGEEYIQKLKSVLIHELRHALDDVKSQGHFRRRHGRGPYTAYRGQDQHDVPWAKRPLEWNAIYTQVTQRLYNNLVEIKRVSPKSYNNIDNDYIARMVAGFLERFNGRGSPFPEGSKDPNYRRMFNRLYDFSISTLQKLQHPAGGTPPETTGEPGSAAPITQYTKRYEKKLPQKIFNLINQNSMNIHTREEAEAAGVRLAFVVEAKLLPAYYRAMKVASINELKADPKEYEAALRITKLDGQAVFRGDFGDGNNTMTSSGQKFWLPDFFFTRSTQFYGTNKFPSKTEATT